jgi:chromosome segregation ATPase
MTFSEDSKQLERSLQATRAMLEELVHALQERRAAWVSIRPDVLAPTAEIEQLSRQLAEQEDRRAALLRRFRDALPTPAGARPEELHVNVTRIAAALPPVQGRALRSAADEVTRLAKLVRTETALGQRLLQFAKNAQSGIGAEVIGAANHDGAAGYDRRARNDNGPNTAGRLVDGRM